MKPLAVIPNYMRTSADLAMLEECLRTLRLTAGDRCDVMVVDDGSPAEELITPLSRIVARYHADLDLKAAKREGFSKTVNVGLRRAREDGSDAILVNADIEFIDDPTRPMWLDAMLNQGCLGREGLASVVGALLMYPTGLIQHAGISFSLLTRGFDHRYRYGPVELAEAARPIIAPVTGALQFIRHECLVEVGLYDESFRMGWEDVDYCVRVWQSGRQCVYQPAIRAIHHESVFRGRADEQVSEWTEYSWRRFCAKHATVNFLEFVPSMTLGEPDD